MAFKQVPAAHVALFDLALPKDPDVERKRMFGCPAGFVNGNLFCGAHEEDFNVRLDDTTRRKAVEMGFGAFTVMGKTMREYVCVPAASVGDEAFLREWFEKGLAYARTLPAKLPKKASKKR